MVRTQLFTDRTGQRWLRLLEPWHHGYNIRTLLTYEQAHGKESTNGE